MIHVDKNLNDIPDSLKTDAQSIDHSPARTTNERRMEIIQQGAYPPSGSSSKYDCRYKLDDIKTSLKTIYNSKCAYCETSLEQLHVDHYRPKRGGYYWLAYSWDNLLLSCPTCNRKKGNDFPIAASSKVVYDENRDTLDQINTLSARYDDLEKPMLINPETASDQLLGTANFNKMGLMSSDDPSMSETIKTCGLDREALNERRKKIWDDLKKELNAAILDSKGDRNTMKKAVRTVLNGYKMRMDNPKEEYIAYRRFLMNSGQLTAASLLT
jgi:uncharacterized protein (TIGR02646 family)